MASTMTLKDRLDIAAKDAEAAQEKITSGTLGREAFRQEVRNYTLAKFFLTEDEVRALGTEDILKLADESVEKLLRQNDKSVKLAEGSTTRAGDGCPLCRRGRFVVRGVHARHDRWLEHGGARPGTCARS